MEQNENVITLSSEPDGLVCDRLFPEVLVKNLSHKQRKAEIRYRKRLSKHRAAAHKKFHYSPDSAVEWSETVAKAARYEVEDKKKVRVAHAIASVLIIALGMGIFLLAHSLASLLLLQAIGLPSGEKLAGITAILVSLSTSFISFFGAWALAYYFTRVCSHFFRLNLTRYKNGRYYAVKMQETVRYYDPLTGGMEAIHRALKKFVKIAFWIAFAIFILLRFGYFLEWGNFFNDAYGPAFILNWAGLFGEILQLAPVLELAREFGYTSVSAKALFGNPFFDSLLFTMLLYLIQITLRCINYGRVCKCCKNVNCFRKEIMKTVEIKHKIRKVANESRRYSGTVDGHSVSVNTGGGYTPKPYTKITTKLTIKYYCDICNTYNDKEAKETSETKNGHTGKPTKRTENYVEH